MERYRNWLEKKHTNQIPVALNSEPLTDPRVQLEMSPISEFYTSDEDGDSDHELGFNPNVETINHDETSHPISTTDAQPQLSAHKAASTGSFVRINVLASPAPLDNLSSLSSAVDLILNAVRSAFEAKNLSVPTTLLTDMHFLLSSMAIKLNNLSRALTLDAHTASASQRICPISPSRAVCFQVI